MRFYLLPKIHKPGNPGRPIVASNGAAIMDKAKEVIDKYMYMHHVYTCKIKLVTMGWHSTDILQVQMLMVQCRAVPCWLTRFVKVC